MTAAIRDERIPALFLTGATDGAGLEQRLGATFDLTTLPAKQERPGVDPDPGRSGVGEKVDRALADEGLADQPVLVLTTNQAVQDSLNTHFNQGLPMPRLVTTGDDREVESLKDQYLGRAEAYWQSLDENKLDLRSDVGGRLDSQARLAGASVPVEAIEVTAGAGTTGSGSTTTCNGRDGQPLTLPAELRLTSSDGKALPLVGNEVRVTVNGERVPVKIGSGGAPGRTGAGGGPPMTTTAGDGESAVPAPDPRRPAGSTPDSGSGLPVVPITMVVVLLAAAAGGWWYLRRGQVQAPSAPYGAGGPGYPGGGPGHPPDPGHPPVVSPDGAVVMPGSVEPASAPQEGSATGRAVTAPVVAPLELRPAAPGWTAAVPYDAAVRVNDLGLMRALPDDGERGRSWGWVTTTEIAGAGWLEKKPDLGEDAEPTLRSHADGRGLVAVYDGVGGAGSATARRLRDGRELTGAYVAARLVRDLVETWYASVVDNDRDAGEVERLARGLSQSLQDEGEFIVETSTLRGKLSRVLPTTMAAVAYRRGADPAQPSTVADVIWAGDSRCYALSAANGLQVLSVDDTRESDAMALIRNDQPMDNLVSADRSFTLHHQRVELGSPVILLAATDGCFGYVKTPAHFEYLLLDKLGNVGDVWEWSAAVIAELGAFTRDDASFSLVALGYDDFASLQGAFADRHAYLDEVHWTPFLEAGEDLVAVERLRDESWSVFRDLYQARMPNRSDRARSSTGNAPDGGGQEPQPS